MTRAHYEAETFIENHIDVPLKPIVGTNPGRKWPLIRVSCHLGEADIVEPERPLKKLPLERMKDFKGLR